MLCHRGGTGEARTFQKVAPGDHFQRTFVGHVNPFGWRARQTDMAGQCIENPGHKTGWFALARTQPY
jgi:hypothetical protein